MDLLTVNETARLLRVSPITIRRYIASGRLPAERVGRGVRVRREAIEDFVTPIAPTAGKRGDDSREELPTMLEALGISVGIGRSGEPTNIAEHKDEYLADAFSASGSDEEDENLIEVFSPSSPDAAEFVPDELLGKPFTMDDPLWDIVGIGQSDEPNDVARNKHKYLADAILSHKSME